jgi:hypothetical protein
MPRNDFPARGQHVEEPISFIDNHRSVTSPSYPDRAQVPWRPLGTVVTSLGAPIGLGVLHPMLGEAIAVIEILTVLTILVTALFGSQGLSERAFRLLRWFGNRSEPPAPSTRQGDEVDGASPIRQG